MSLLRRLLGRRSSAGRSDLVIEPTGAKDLGPCSCCGDNSRTVWGFVHRGAAAEAAYFVQWTLGQIDRHGAHFDLVLGAWGDGTTRDDRYAVSLELRRTSDGPSFMVIDAGERDISHGDLAHRGLSREAVVGTPTAKQAFEIIDAIWLQDERLAEMRAAG